MSAKVHPVYNAYCDDCAEGYGPFDEEEDADDAALVHNQEYHGPHVCEAWMVRRRPEGGRYCAACGADKS